MLFKKKLAVLTCLPVILPINQQPIMSPLTMFQFFCTLINICNKLTHEMFFCITISSQHMYHIMVTSNYHYMYWHSKKIPLRPKFLSNEEGTHSSLIRVDEKHYNSENFKTKVKENLDTIALQLKLLFTEELFLGNYMYSTFIKI